MTIGIDVDNWMKFNIELNAKKEKGILDVIDSSANHTEFKPFDKKYDFAKDIKKAILLERREGKIQQSKMLYKKLIELDYSNLEGTDLTYKSLLFLFYTSFLLRNGKKKEAKVIAGKVYTQRKCNGYD